MPDSEKDKITQDERLSQVHSDTMYFVSGIVREFRLYPEILDAMRNGKASVELRKRILLRAVDEVWVTAIEDTLPALEQVTRNPSHFIEETEQVLPIELTKSVSDRSIKHLAQHTDLISKVEGDTITPSKLLNVFHDETIQTYENKFVNTLISHLYTFVHMRYEAAEEQGQDVRSTSLDFSDSFTHGEVRGKVHLRVELEDKPDADEVEKNYLFTSDLWRRVQKLHQICSDYMTSQFVRDMGKSYIRPPVMRTNALLNNKNLRQCLSLWEFLQSYNNTGYTTVVEDKLLDIDEAYIREIYSTMAMEYLLFRHRTEKGFDPQDELASATVDEPLRPEVVEDLLPATVSEFALHVRAIDETRGERTAEETEILKALEVALLADEVLRRREEAEETRDTVYDRSFLARLVIAQEPAQTFYTEIKNYLLSFNEVKSRVSWRHDNFTYRQKPCAQLTVRGKTLCVFLPLNPADPKYAKYPVVDKSDVAAHKKRPFCVKVRSRRTLKYVFGFIDEVMQNLGVTRNENARSADYRYPRQTLEELLRQKLVRLIGEKKQEDEGAVKHSFLARLVLAQEPTQTYYTEIKNRLLAHKGVHSRVSWKFDTFNRGRTVCARLAVRGKTLWLYLNANLTDEQIAHYHTQNFSDRKQYEKTPVGLKVKSGRSLKYALELVGIAMNDLGIPLAEVAEKKDFRMKLLQTQELITKRWTKRGEKVRNFAKNISDAIDKLKNHGDSPEAAEAPTAQNAEAVGTPVEPTTEPTTEVSNTEVEPTVAEPESAETSEPTETTELTETEETEQHDVAAEEAPTDGVDDVAEADSENSASGDSAVTAEAEQTEPAETAEQSEPAEQTAHTEPVAEGEKLFSEEKVAEADSLDMVPEPIVADDSSDSDDSQRKTGFFERIFGKKKRR